jgi:tetratricopeptide (TPR) repeat protein
LHEIKGTAMKTISGIIFLALVSFTLTGQTAKELYDAGFKLFNSRDYNGAIGYFSKALEIDPSIEQAYESRGISRYNLNSFQEALSDFDKAVELTEGNPNPNLFSCRGLAKTALKDFSGAVEDLNTAIEQSGGKVPTYYIMRSSAKYFLRDYQGAIADCDFAIKSESTPAGSKAEAYFWRGLSKVFSGGLTDDGCQDLKKSAESGYPNAAAAIKNYCQ